MDWLRELAVSGVEAGWLSDSFSYAFMVNAIVAALILGPLLGGLGTLVIAKRLAFFSEAVGHAAQTLPVCRAERSYFQADRQRKPSLARSIVSNNHPENAGLRTVPSQSLLCA